MSWVHYLESSRGDFVSALHDVETFELRTEMHGTQRGRVTIKPQNTTDLDSLLRSLRASGGVIVTAFAYKPVTRGLIDLDSLVYDEDEGTVTVSYGPRKNPEGEA